MKSLFEFGAHAGAHRVAVRAGMSVLVPLVVLYSISHIEWSIFAAFGAFTSVYGRNTAYALRLRMQGIAAAIMVSSVLLGAVVAVLPNPEYTVVAVAAVWALVVAFVSDAARLSPPGPLFAVFGLCSVASVPAGPNEFALAFTVSAGAALFALLVGQVGRVRAGQVRNSTWGAISAVNSSRESAGSAVRSAIVATLRRPGELRHLSRFAVAAAVAGSLSTGLGIGHPYWSMVAAIVPLVAIDLGNSFVRGAHRLLGTVAGLALASVLLLFAPSGLWAIGLVAALQVVAELFVVRNYGFALVFVTPLALIMVSLAHPVSASALITDRAVETLLGTVVAIVVALGYWLAFGRSRRTSPATTPPGAYTERAATKASTSAR
ncbi:FUSC family protein [Subtercola sp. RTI3]|uniref:FUSC family protein n=1 Tax=Subtercola sp. RTI3 TaxID=3048639 RepID=UPI002B233AD9|nr:FUSC family protein [Subtercola sp. RTI3]MEA9985268.1 FUSC family protein [Subtercola sp. RTI3]